MTVAKELQLDEQATKAKELIGLTLAQWNKLRDSGYTTEAILAAHADWQKQVKRELAWEYKNPDYRDESGAPFLSAVQAARALGIGEFLVCNLNHRGKLPGTKVGRRIAYSRDDLLKMATRNYSRVPSKRSPLAKSFIRWLELREDAAA